MGEKVEKFCNKEDESTWGNLLEYEGSKRDDVSLPSPPEVPAWFIGLWMTWILEGMIRDVSYDWLDELEEVLEDIETIELAETTSTGWVTIGGDDFTAFPSLWTTGSGDAWILDASIGPWGSSSTTMSEGLLIEVFFTIAFVIGLLWKFGSSDKLTLSAPIISSSCSSFVTPNDKDSLLRSTTEDDLDETWLTTSSWDEAVVGYTSRETVVFLTLLVLSMDFEERVFSKEVECLREGRDSSPLPPEADEVPAAVAGFWHEAVFPVGES